MRKKLSLIFSFLCFFAVSSVKAQCPTHIQETLKNTVVSYIGNVNVGENGEFFIMNPYPGATYTATNTTTGEVFTSSESTLFRGTHSINVGTMTQGRNFLIKAVHGTCVYDVGTRYLYTRATTAGPTLQYRTYDEYCDRGGEIMYRILGSDRNTSNVLEPVTNDDYDFYRQQPDGSWGSPIDPNGTSGLTGGANAGAAQSYKIRAVKKSDPTKTLEVTVSITNRKQAINASLKEEYGQCDAASTIRVIPQNGLRYPLYFTLVRVKDLGGGQVEEETIISRQTSPYFTGIERKTDGMGNGYKVYVTDGCSAGNTNSFEIALQHFKPTEVVNYEFYASPHNVGGCDVGYMNFYQRLRITNKTSFASEIFPYPFTFSYKFISPSGREYPYTHTFNNKEEMLEFFYDEQEYPWVKNRLYTDVPAETGVWTREASYTVCGQTYPIATVTREVYKTEDRMKMFARTYVSNSADCQRQQIVGQGAYAWAHTNMNMYYILKTFPPCYNPEADGWAKNSQFGGAWTKFGSTSNDYVIVSPTKIAGTNQECVGTYTFDVANSCGERVSQHITSRNLQGLNSSPQSWTNIESTTAEPITQTGTFNSTYTTYGSCSANYNFVRNINLYNDVIDEIELVSYTKHADVPATVNLPADITIGGVIPTSYKKAQNSWEMDEMPAGTYKFKLTKNTSCGVVVREHTLTYAPEIDDEFKVEQVGCNWVMKRVKQTGTLAPRVYYALQWFNDKTGRWEDPHSANNNQYNAGNINATGITLNSSTGLYSYGKYRIVRLYSFYNDFNRPTCIRPVPGQEFELKSSEPLITDIVGLDCNDNIYQVAVMAEALNQPLTYKITNIAGVELGSGSISNGVNNIFFSIQVTNSNSPYTFQVTDACGIQRVRIITPGEWAGNLKITPDKEMHCSNNSATLSVPDLGNAFSYEWYREDAPNNILSTTHKLEIASLTAADFANKYKVRLKNASTNTSARQCINKEVDYQFQTDPALTPLPDISAMIQDVEICALPENATTYDVLKNLFKDAPIGGELYVEETGAYIDASTNTNPSQRGRFFINLNSYGQGEYTFVYTIKDICGNQSQAKAKLTRKAQLASPPTNNNAQTINICSETENPTFAKIEAQYRAKVGAFLDPNTKLYWYRGQNDNATATADYNNGRIDTDVAKANPIYTTTLPAFGANDQVKYSYLYVGVLPEPGSKYCESEPIRITISRYKMPATLANTSLAVCEPYTFTEVARDLAEKLKVGTTNLDLTWFKFYKIENGVETEVTNNTSELENNINITYKFRYNQNQECLSTPYDLTVTFNNRPPLRQTTTEQLTLCNLTVGEARAELQKLYPNSTILISNALRPVMVNGINIPSNVLNSNLGDTNALTEGSTYYFTYQNTGEICASQVGTFVATKSNVKPAPVSDLNFCHNENISALVARLTGTNIKLYRQVGSTYTLVDASTYNTTKLVAGERFFYTTTPAGTTCESEKAQITYALANPSAPALKAGTSNKICATATADTYSLAQLVVVPTGYELVWYDAQTGGTPTNGNVDTNVTATTPITRWAALKTLASGTPASCEGTARTKVEVVINYIPSATLVSTTPAEVCATSTSEMYSLAGLVNAPTGYELVWYEEENSTTPTTDISVDKNVTTEKIFKRWVVLKQTDAPNCESLTRIEVSVKIKVTAAPTGDTTQTFCGSATISNLTATGTDIKWYEAATGGTALDANTDLVNGTTYYASQTLNGCESLSRLAVQVTIETPSAPTLNANTREFCPTTTSTSVSLEDFVNAPATGYELVWYETETATASTTDISVDRNVTAEKIFTRWVAQKRTATPNCESTRTKVEVTIKDETEPVISGATDKILDCNDPNFDTEVTAWIDAVTARDACVGTTTVTHNYTKPADLCNTRSISVTFTSTDTFGNTTTEPKTITLVNIDAVDDNIDNVDSITGGTDILDVLATDTLNGNPATINDDVTISVETAATPINGGSVPTLNLATGKVSVPAGTPAGEYEIEYQICDKQNTGICDKAKVTIKVVAPTITAVDNNYLVLDNSQDFVSGTDILDNDLLGNRPATTTNVAITQLSTTNNGVNIDPATGKVKVDANTPAGTYVIAYKICDKVNATNCTDAKVYVKVLDRNIPTTITAVNDNYVVPNGDTGATVGKIYDNDQVNGNTPTETSVTLTVDSIKDGNNQPSTQIEVKPNGDIEVKPNTPAGVYTIQYTICDKAATPSCSTAIVKVVVNTPTTTVPTTNLPKIVAIPDEYSVTDPTQDTNNIGNILANDSSTAGTTPTNADTSLTINSVKDKDGNDASGKVIVNANGSVDVKANTPAGEYTVVYTICDSTQANVCSTSTAKVIVPSPSITAVDNNYLVLDNSQDFVSGTDILDNDLLGNHPATTTNVVITQLSTTNNGVNIDPATGKVKVDANTPAGTYTISYKICDKVNATNCTDAKVYVKVLDKTIPTTITAVNDNYVVPNGDTGATVGKIYDNDQVNGNTPTETSVTLTVDSIKDGNNQPSTQIEVKPNGDIEVKPNTPAGVYTIQYTICDKAATPSCSTAIVKVVVNTPTTTVPTTNLPKIVAIPDEYSVTDPTQDTNNIGNILANDSSTAGTTPTNADTSLTINSVKDKDGNDASGKVIVNANGSVDVKANTPAGEYTVVYTICDSTQANVCSTSTAKVIVPSPSITAVDNNYLVLDNSQDFVSGTDILDNDLLGNHPATTTNVVITQLSTTNNGVNIDPATGKVKVDANTPAGTYTISYKICDKVNATNCTDAKVYVKVLDKTIPTTITAVNDNYVVPNGDTGATVGKIYDNDQVNGNTPTETSVTLTVDSIKDGNNQPSTQIEVKPNGDIEVKPNTPAGVYTIQYTICDKAATPSCSTAIVKVVVNTPTTTVPTTNLPKIVAIPDEYSVTDPTQDTNNIGNILANDSSTAGTTPTNADTSLTINSVKDKDGNDASGKVIVNANGSVDVKANTPAGEYTVVYTICDSTQANVCSTSTAKVIVPSPSITAVDNNYLVLDNSQDFVSGTDILDNDLLGNHPATTTNVVITQLSTTNNGVNIDPATGKVKVDANTPAGTYTISYKICDKVNATNCTDAKVYVKVLDKTIPTTITAVNDNYVVPNGDTGATVGKIYDNDQVNGNTPTETSVTLTVDSIKDGNNQPSTQIEVKPNGDIEVKPNTPAGVYTIQYTICDKAATPSCSTAIVKVVVNTPTTTVPTTNLPKIVAIPDEYSVTDPTQDTNNIGNILANDSSTAGTTPTNADTSLTINSVKDKDGNDASGKVIVNANGSVDVKANTPAGEYTVVYTICDSTQANVCSTSTAKVIVPSPSITAVDNNYLVLDNSQDFVSGTDILDNDLLGNHPATTTNVVITQLSTTNNGVNIDPATGKVKVDANTPAGTYTISYKICDKVNATNCTDAKVYVKVLDKTIPTTITAVNDNYVVPNGDTGATVGKIYDNDQVNGNTPTETSVTLTVDSIKDGNNQPSTQIEVKPNGDIEVKPNTPAGVYTIQYTICDKAATPSCSTAIVKVVVNTPTTTVPTTNLPKIVAIPDEYSVTDPTQDTNNIGNILANDSSTAGTTPDASNTTLTIHSVKDKDGNDASTNIKVNTDGSVDVKANTPAGEYTVVYTICDSTQANVCSTSTAKVIVPAPAVVPPVIVATPNIFTITDSTKGGVTPSILDDDDLGGRTPNEVEIKSTPVLDSSNNPSTGITINTDGTVAIAPNTPAGTYTFEYSVCDKATGVCSEKVKVTIVVEAKGCELEFYNGISKNGDDLNDSFVIKGIECYPDNTLKIFNRWGVLVFEQDGYNNNFKGYSNGRVTINKDEELPQGTYYYIFDYKDSEGKSNRRAGWLYKR